MGRAFSSHYLETVGVTAPWDVGTGDFSVSAWVRTTRTQDVAVASWAGGSDWWIGLSGSGQATFSLLGGAAVEPAATVNDGNWRLLSGCRVSGTMRVFVDGVLRATASSSGNSNPASTLSIGRLGAAFPAYWIGDIAEVAFWQTVGLSDAEMAALGKGYSPRFIRRQSLTAYWPIIGNQSPEPDLRNGYNATLNGPPTKTVHPRIIYPVGLWSSTPAAGGSVGALVSEGGIAFSASSNLTATGSLVSAGAMAFGGSATTTGTGSLSSAGAIAFSGSSDAILAGVLVSQASVGFSGSSVMAGFTSLNSEAPIAFAASSGLTGTGALTSEASFGFSGTSSFLEEALASECSFGFSASSNLTGVGALVSAGCIAFAAESSIEAGGLTNIGGIYRHVTEAFNPAGLTTLQVEMLATSGAVVAHLFDETSAIAVPSSVVSTSSPTLELVESNPISLIDNHDYRVQVGPAGGGELLAARIVCQP